MLIPDNTYAIANTYSGRFLRGLAADVDPLQQAVDAANAGIVVGDGAATPTDTTDWAKIGTAVNAEGVFIANLFRQAAGKPPLPASTAPGVNVGLTPETQTLVKYGVGALLVGLLLLRRR